MYSNKSNPSGIKNNGYELSNLIEGNDIFNSELLYRITKYPEYKLLEYRITNKSHTPTSLADAIYGNYIYSWILIIFNPELGRFRYSIGDIVKYPDMNEFQEYLRKI